MEEKDLRDLERIFAQVEDPRMERTKLHRLRDIIILAICGVLCGAEGWAEIEEFGKAKEAFFTELLALPNGIPSHDTFGRVFALIDPKQFEASFVQWVQGISKTVKGVVAIDGKTLRRSHDQTTGKKALHLVSAWAVENRLVLAQLATEEKSNELTAIPLLLQQLALNGCIVTIDAMGTQTKIAKQIIEQDGDDEVRLTELRRCYEESSDAETRTRFQMLLLSLRGQTSSQIAQHVLRSQDTVVRVLKRFVTGGVDAVPRRTAPGRERTVTAARARRTATSDRGGSP